MKVYDVIVEYDKNKCEQLYKALLKAGCKGLDHEVCFLRDAVFRDRPHYLRYAYRITLINDKIHYNCFKNIDEVIADCSISVTDFINIIQPERTVTL